MFGSSSPLSTSFWSSPTKQAGNISTRGKSSEIDLKRLSVFNVASHESNLSPTSTNHGSNGKHQKENKAVRNSPSKLGKEEVIVELMKEIRGKDALIASMQARLDKSPEKIRARKHRLSQMKSHIIHDNGRMNARVARSGSLLTARILEAIPDPEKTPSQSIAESFVKVFQKPDEHIAYLQSQDFARHLIEVCDAVEEIFEDEPKCLAIQSPAYVIGDIHGNLEDLHFFADNLWKLGVCFLFSTCCI